MLHRPTAPASARRAHLASAHAPAHISTAGWGTYLVLAAVVAVSAFPLYYTFVMASHTNAEMAAATPPLLPTLNIFDNFREALKLAPLNQGLLNSLFVSSAVTLSTVSFCTLAGFAFTKLRFRWRNVLLGLCVATMMVPGAQMGIIPLYMMMARFGLAGHLQSVILPTMVTAFGVFFMRQYPRPRYPTSCSRPLMSTGPGRSAPSSTSSCRPCALRWPCSGCSRSSPPGTTSSGPSSR